MFIWPAHLTSFSVHIADWAWVCGLEHLLSLCIFRHSHLRHLWFVYSSMEAQPSTWQNHYRRTDEVAGFCDRSKARVGLQQRLSWTKRWCRMTVSNRSWKNWTDPGRSLKTKTKRRRPRRPSSRLSGNFKTETTFMSYVERRKLNFQQLEHALSTPLPAVIKGYVTSRDAKLTECSYDKEVM